jgi:hypothetical protein
MEQSGGREQRKARVVYDVNEPVGWLDGYKKWYRRRSES